MTMKSVAVGVFAGVMMLAAASRAATYELDVSHTTIGFGVKHMVVSTTYGKFGAFGGSLEMGDDGVLSKASAEIEVASIDTKNEKRDEHLRSPDFFDAAKFPKITFESTKVEKAGDGVKVTGNLTIRDVTKEVEIPVSVSGPVKDPWGNERIGVEGTLKINRKDYGLTWSKTMDGGGLVVGDEVSITISAEGIKKQ